MDIISGYAQLTQAIVDTTGMTRSTLHIHVGMAIYLLAQFLLRDRRSSIWALLLVLEIELGNEFLNRLHYGSWRWNDTLQDIVLTLFWPLLSYSVSLFRRKQWKRRNRVRLQAAEVLGRGLKTSGI